MNTEEEEHSRHSVFFWVACRSGLGPISGSATEAGPLSGRWSLPSFPSDRAIYYSTIDCLLFRLSSLVFSATAERQMRRARASCYTSLSACCLTTTENDFRTRNFTRLVLCCIEAKFCKKIFVGKLSPRSTECTPLHRL